MKLLLEMSSRVEEVQVEVDLQELKESSPAKPNIRYKQWQGSSLVTAAAVARFTDPRVFQLVVFKEMAMEVWEVEETRQRKVACGALERTVSHCCVLETSKLMSSCQDATSAALHCDLLLVTDGSGGLTVLEWNVALSEVQEPGQIKIHLSPELESASEVLPSTPLFSCPLYLPKRASMKRSSSPTAVQPGMTSKVEGISLVAMSLYQGTLGILCVEWTSTYPTLLKECGVWPITLLLTPKLDLHFVALTTENSIHSPMAKIVNPFVVRDLAFLEGGEGAGYGNLDVKGRPLLVLLSSQQGFFHHSLRVQCMALDLSTFLLQPGPWEIRNVNPSTSLLLPWSFVGNLGDAVGIKGAYFETGFRAGSGVLAVSSAGIMFIEASGRRASLPLHLGGLPTCWVKLPQNQLVLGDDTGALHVLELSSWKEDIISKIVLNDPLPSVNILVRVLGARVTESKAKAGKEHSVDNIIFVSGQAGDSQLLKLIRTGEPVKDFPISCGDKWSGKTLAVKSSALLESLAPMRGVILVKEAIHSPDPFLLLACGNAPASTVRKGSLMAAFCVDTIIDADVRGLPQLLPFHEFWGLEFHTHILVSYPLANVSEVMTVRGTWTGDHFMCGLERRECTLALSAQPGGWFIQITETSLRVLANDSSLRGLKAEWKVPLPPPDSRQSLNISSKKIHHAALTPEGALLVSGAAVFSVGMDCFGVPHTIACSDRPHQVSALGLCHVGDFRLDTIAKELVVVIAQWTTNTVHLLSWPSLEEIVTMDACTAPVLSVALGRLAMNNYLFAGTADGYLVYYEVSDIRRSRNENAEATNLEGLPSAMGEEEKEINRILRNARTVSIVPSNLQAITSTLENENLNQPQYSLRHGRMIKVGSSITHVEFGCFDGGRVGGISSRTESFGSEVDEECLYIWSERSLVLLPQQQQDFHAVVLHCPSQLVPKSTKLHTEDHPHGLVGATADGKILCGHLDLSIKLRWQVLKVEGTAVHVAHHRSSGCIAFISIDGVSSNLHIAHEVSMLQLLIVELECNHFPKVLASLQLPYTIYSPNKESVECLVVATQTMHEQKITGLILFFDVQVTYASEKEVKYELRLLGLHHLDQPCISVCMVDSPPKPFTPSPCGMCNLSSLPVADDPWLLEIMQCLEHASKHWSRCCIDRICHPGAPQKDADHVPRGAFLALGFRGKVELLYVFVGASEACMLVVPAVAAALDAPFLPLAGIYEDCDDEHPEGFEDEEETLLSASEATAEGTPGVQTTPPVRCGLGSKWTTSSRINIQNLASFDTPGGGCVTALVPMPKGTILVVEKLHGLSVFEISAEGLEVMLLAWQPCSFPLESVIPLSDDLYLLSMHGNGCQVMERDYPAEAAYQVEEKLRQDLETELVNVQDQVQDGTPRNTTTLELHPSMERLPCLKHAAAAAWTASACQLSSGSLSLESMPLTRMPTISKMVQTIAAVTPTGEVGVITVSQSSPSGCFSDN